MKLMHIADLHIGKVVNDFSMLGDQKYVLEQIIKIAQEENMQVLMIAGDVYDRSIPSAEAVTLLDWFLSKIIDLEIKVFLISGNHDSPERISFAGSILEKKGLCMEGVFSGKLKEIQLQDSYGNVNFYLLPFVKPGYVKQVLQKEEIHNYEESVRAVLDERKLNKDERNILITHYFVTNAGKQPEQSESENSFSIGGVDNVDVSVFADYDYVALGHIHGPQKIGKEWVRYAGSPLKYSFSEVFHKKSVTIIDLREKGKVNITKRELKPLHDMRKIKGELKDLMKEEVYSQGEKTDYLHITLTNREELFDPLSTLRSVYPNIMQLIFEKNIKRQEYMPVKEETKKVRTTLELYEEFYTNVTEYEFDKDRKNVMGQLIEELERDIL